MNAAELKGHYAAELKETIVVRRYTGAGVNRPKFDVEARGKAWGYAAKELVGAIQQGDTRVLIYRDDLVNKGFALPLLASDKLVVKGREIAIISPSTRKAPDGTVVVDDIHARG